jgi:GNAT superfamily N-acetyltransferase
LQIICSAFEISLDGARPLFFADPLFNLQNKWLLFGDDGAVATASVTPIDLNLGDRFVRCAGIAGVATEPRLQGRGYASELLAQLLERLSEDGFDVAALVPARTELYERLGFRYYADRWSIQFSLAPFVDPMSEMPRGMCEEDRPRIRELYEQFGESRPGAAKRDDARWGYLFWHNQTILCVGQPVEQYMICSYTPEGLLIKELLPPNPRRQMINYLADRGPITVAGWREDVEPWREFSDEEPACEPFLMAKALSMPWPFDPISNHAFSLFACDLF